MALSAGRIFKYRGGYTISVPVAASTTIYQGSLVVFTQGTAGATVATDAATKKFVGISMETVDNSSGSAGDKLCEVLVGAEVLLPAASVTQATFGGYKLYAVDDETVGLAATTSADVEVGMGTTAESTTEVWVLLNSFGAVGA